MTENGAVEALREIVCDVLEIDEEELQDSLVFVEAYDADSLQAIEILARIEKEFRVEIPQSELPNMSTFGAVRSVTARYAGWDR